MKTVKFDLVLKMEWHEKVKMYRFGEVIWIYLTIERTNHRNRYELCKNYIWNTFGIKMKSWYGKLRSHGNDLRPGGGGGGGEGGGGGTRSEKWWGGAAGRWKLDPKRSREKWNLGPKRSNSVRIGSFNTPKDRFGVGGWEKIPQKDRARSCQSEKRGSKPRHICITHHPPPPPPPPPPGDLRPGICVVIFAAGFNMSDNWAITLNAKYHVPLVTKHAKN